MRPSICRIVSARICVDVLNFRRREKKCIIDQIVTGITYIEERKRITCFSTCELRDIK